MSLTKQQALDLYRSDDLIGLGMEVEPLCGREPSAARRESAGEVLTLSLPKGKDLKCQ